MAHVLVVEDEPELAEIFQRLLGQMGHTCDVAYDGRAAYRLVMGGDYEFDLILCDLHLPKMTGGEFLRSIYGTVRWKTPVVVISGVAYMIEALGELRKGAFSIVQKPIGKDGFEEVVDRALDQRAAYRRIHDLESKVTRLQENNTALLTRNDELFEQARMDVLTRLPNRLRLLEDLSILDANWRRYESQFAIALCDVDDFGHYNKQHSLEVGDAALRVVAETMRDACRRGDSVYRFGRDEAETAYRFGGDEFVLILAAQNQKHAIAAVERIRTELAESRGQDLPGGRVTISVGVVANEPTNKLTVEEMLRLANERLKEAKAAGGDCIRPAPRPESKEIGKIEEKPSSDEGDVDDTEAPVVEATRPSGDPSGAR